MVGRFERGPFRLIPKFGLNLDGWLVGWKGIWFPPEHVTVLNAMRQEQQLGLSVLSSLGLFGGGESARKGGGNSRKETCRGATTVSSFCRGGIRYKINIHVAWQVAIREPLL